MPTKEELDAWYRRPTEEIERVKAEAERRAGDAQRHAEWSRQMADELGPGFSRAIGFAHEVEASLPRVRSGSGYYDGGRSIPTFSVRVQPLSEFAMDMRNNAEGIAASEQRRPIEQGRLQTAPGVVRRR